MGLGRVCSHYRHEAGAGGGAGWGVDDGGAVFPERAGGRLWPLAVVVLSTVIASEYNG